IVLVLMILPVALPIMLIAIPAILFSMGRPVFFNQPRVGQGGQVFKMWKLRSMRNATPQDRVIATSINDNRITPLGGFLRRFRVDELPQLWNVLKGDMSFIGPRPEQPALSESYERVMPAFAYRHLVRPGITGWAQVRAGYAADLEETRIKLSYDLFYIKNFSFWLDLQILWRTVGALLNGGGVR
ncbi:MAG: sugar transferase, partial [Zymomonas sp.]